MSQQRNLDVGFRSYKVMNAAVADAKNSLSFEQVMDRVLIRNTGTSDALLRFNLPLNDQILIKASERLDIPLKVKHVMYVCPTALQTTTLEIIGLLE